MCGLCAHVTTRGPLRRQPRPTPLPQFACGREDNDVQRNTCACHLQNVTNHRSCSYGGAQHTKLVKAEQRGCARVRNNRVGNSNTPIPCKVTKSLAPLVVMLEVRRPPWGSSTWSDVLKKKKRRVGNFTWQCLHSTRKLCSCFCVWIALHVPFERTHRPDIPKSQLALIPMLTCRVSCVIRPVIDWNNASLFRNCIKHESFHKFMLCPDQLLTNQLTGYSPSACMVFFCVD